MRVALPQVWRCSVALKRVSWKLGDDKRRLSEDFPGMEHDDREPQFDNILRPFFRKSGSHCTGLDEPFVANFFYRGSWPTFGPTIEITGPLADTVFYDRSIMGDLGAPPFESTSPNFRIMYKEKFVGIICPGTQTLWATDWVHGRNLRPATRKIIATLLDNGLLRPITEDERRMGITPKEPEESKEIKYPEYSITMGCDPEFELVEDGYVRHASKRLGSDFDLRHPEFGQFGLDGAGDQVEIRPEPGEAVDVIKNIRGLLGLFEAHSMGEYTAAASSDQYPCGGHIHIGVRPRPSYEFFHSLTGVLDDFIGRPTKGLNGVCRGKGEYGTIHDWREQSHGMEYRTPPGAIFRSPELGRITLQLAYNLAYMLANTRELEYERIDVETLISVGGLVREDAEFFIQECTKDFPTHNECLLAAWGIEKRKLEHHIRVEFGEEWSPEVTEYVKAFFINLEPIRNMRVRFFGLREDRGNVYTFRVEDREMISHYHADYINFGFSRKFRFGREPYEKMLEILNAVKLLLELRLGSPISFRE